jgi:hypothetical protein
MPNWMSNTMTVTGDADELTQFVTAAEKNKESLLSFQKLYPCPEELLNQSADSIHDIGYEVFFDPSNEWERIAKYPWVIEKGLSVDLGRKLFQKCFKEKFKDSGYYEAGVETEKMIRKYGYKNWYDWRNANWGTKWDTKDVTRHIFSSVCIRYDYETPWSPPSALFETISKQYPGLRFHFECNDEGYDGDEPEFIFDIQNGMMT